jgi:predicted nicotinamide N-methyase
MRRVLRDLEPLSVERVDLPGTTLSLQVRRPRGPADGADGHLPYWADVWPSGVVLAGMVVREPALFQGRRVLELGPGVGVTAIAVLKAGAELVVADSALGALALCTLNARDQVGVAPQALPVDWRSPSRELFAAAGDGFAIVLAADVLYDQADVGPLVRLLERILAPDGELWLAEPGRPSAARFVEALRGRGWSGWSEACDSPWADPHDGKRDIVTVHRLRRPGP